MSSFLLLTRRINDAAQPVAISLNHVIAVYPATDFNRDGTAIEAVGADVWTSLEAGSSDASPWRVLESYDEISRQVTAMSLRDWFAGQALAGIMANPSIADDGAPGYAYFLADAMLAARSLVERKEAPYA